MKRIQVVVRVVAALSMALALLAGLTVTTSAAPNPSGGARAEWDGESFPPLFGSVASDEVCDTMGCEFVQPYYDGVQEVYFPAVGNADDSAGLGPAQTSITVQNITANDAYIFVYVGTPEDDDGVDLDDWEAVEVAYLSGGASKTFQASDLEIPLDETRPVAVVGYNRVEVETTEGGEVLILAATNLAGVAKQAAYGESLPYTTPADVAVSGYNAIGGRELGFFDELYFPIVQTNCGPGGCWNSILRIANMGMRDNAAVTVRFFPADDGSGSLQEGFQLQDTVDVGETWSIDLAAWVPQGWVGTAHVYTDDAVGAIVDRVKVGTDMWITNTASNATSEYEWQHPNPIGGSYPAVLFAPDVRSDYNGWNTGINVTNLGPGETDVSIQYFGSNGNAPATQTRRLGAHGMTYFYNPSDPSEDRCEQPSTDVPGCEFIGGAIILATTPVAVAVDGVKYFGGSNDANVGQAFSYSATGNAYDALTAALVQKGNPANGMGATSGINVMNPNAEAATVEATWLNPSGFDAANFGSSIVWVPGYATGFVYTMFHNNLPNGYVGSAIVDSTLPIIATTANVDYQINGDGTAIWNLSNPCGFFRQEGECIYQSPLEPLPADSTLTKEVLVDNPFDDSDELEPLAGALVRYSGGDDRGFEVSGSGLTAADGSVTFVVPSGTYDITVTADAPDGYVYGGDLSDDDVFTWPGEATTVTNVLELEIAEGTGTLTKILDLGDITAEDYESLESEVYFCPPVPDGDGDESFDDCIDNAVVAGGYGEDGMADNTVSAEVPAGAYSICTHVDVIFDTETEDGTVLLHASGCESVSIDADGDEQPIIVLDGGDVVVVNDFAAQAEGELEVFVREDVFDSPIYEAEVCYFDADGELIECDLTDPQGESDLDGASAGTYTVTVSADGYEQESYTFYYSPLTDALDGRVDDEDADADHVASLDPVLSVLNAEVLLTGGGAAIGVTVYVDPVGQCGNGTIASGITGVSGLYSVAVAPGEYCVNVQQLFSDPSVIIEPGDPADDIDAQIIVSLG